MTYTQGAMGLDNPLHIAFLVVILLLVFGAKRLPEIGRSLGSGMREFKQGITGDTPPQQTQQPTLTAAQPQPPAPMPVAQPAAAQPAPAPPPVAAQPAPPDAAPVESEHAGTKPPG
jgi:sec-independent protein translocase protein TatA